MIAYLAIRLDCRIPVAGQPEDGLETRCSHLTFGAEGSTRLPIVGIKAYSCGCHALYKDTGSWAGPCIM